MASWGENPYWQYFCGAEYFMDDFPYELTSLMKWRQRVGVEGNEGERADARKSVAAARREGGSPRRR